MPSLKEKVIADLTASMKAKDELKTSTLRMLKASLMNFEVSGADKVATDEVMVDLIKKGIKQRREAAEGFEKGGNRAMAEKELAEIKILEIYLPAQMSEEELKGIVKEVAAEFSKASPGDPSVASGDLRASFGKVMGAVMGKVKGKADGTLVSKVVKEILG